MLQGRALSLSTHAFTDVTRSFDAMSPVRGVYDPHNSNDDFGEYPFSCPAASRVIPVPTPAGSASSAGAPTRMFLVTGDEYTVLYEVVGVPASPRMGRSSISGSSPVAATATSPRGANTRRSPQAEMASSQGKRRKSNTAGGTARRTSTGGETWDRWEMKPVCRVRQGFGQVLA